MAGEASVKFAAGLVDKKMVAVVGTTSTHRILHKAMATAFHKVHVAARHEAKLHKRAPKNKNAAKKGKSHNTKKPDSKKHAAKGKGKTTKAKKSSHKKKEAPKKKKASKKNNKKNEKKTKKMKGKKQGKKLLLTQLSAATRQKMMAYIAAHSKVAVAAQKK
jgi:hypothetical protein